MRNQKAKVDLNVSVDGGKYKQDWYSVTSLENISLEQIDKLYEFFEKEFGIKIEKNTQWYDMSYEPRMDKDKTHW